MHTKHYKTDLLLIGHYTHDILINGKDDTTVHRMGGGVAYASVVATAFRQQFKVISKVGTDFHYRVQCQQTPIVSTQESTTSFINYTSEIPRRHHVSTRCEPIYPNDIQSTYDIAMVCSVIGEVPSETIQKLREKSNVLMGDIQGMIRKVDISGNVKHVHIDQTEYKDVLSLFDYLKLSDEELPYIDVSMIRKNTTLLVTYGNNGCTVYQKDSKFHVSTHAILALDSTGAGDSFLTGFAIGIQKKLSLKEAVRLGNRCGGVSVQSIGTPTAGDYAPLVEKENTFLETFKRIISPQVEALGLCESVI